MSNKPSSEDIRTAFGHKAAGLVESGELTLHDLKHAYLSDEDSDDERSVASRESDYLAKALAEYENNLAEGADIPDLLEEYYMEEYLNDFDDDDYPAPPDPHNPNKISKQEFIRRRREWEKKRKQRIKEALEANIAESNRIINICNNIAEWSKLKIGWKGVEPWVRRRLAVFVMYTIAYPGDTALLVVRNFGGLVNRRALMRTLESPDKPQMVRAFIRQYKTHKVGDVRREDVLAAKRLFDIEPVYKQDRVASSQPPKEIPPAPSKVAGGRGYAKMVQLFNRKRMKAANATEPTDVPTVKVGKRSMGQVAPIKAHGKTA